MGNSMSDFPASATIIELSTRQRIDATERLLFMRQQQAAARKPATDAAIAALAELTRQVKAKQRLDAQKAHYAAYGRRHGKPPETAA